jgi:hypothetical protein
MTSESIDEKGWPITLNMAVSSRISGSEVINEMPGVRDVSSEQAVARISDMMSADMILFMLALL